MKATVLSFYCLVFALGALTCYVECNPYRVLNYRYSEDWEVYSPRSSTGKVAVVSGTTRGQGYFIALELVRRGWRVFGIGRTKIKDITQGPILWDQFEGDLNDDKDIEKFVQFIIASGVKRVHAVHLNAGEMANVYHQDNNARAAGVPIKINYLGNLGIYQTLLKNGLLDLKAPDFTTVGWTISIAGIFPLTATAGYGPSKAAIKKWIDDATFEALTQGNNVYHYGIIPSGVSTNISLVPYNDLNTFRLCQDVVASQGPFFPPKNIKKVKWLPPAPYPPGPNDNTHPIEIANYVADIISMPTHEDSFYVMEMPVDLQPGVPGIQNIENSVIPNMLTMKPLAFANWLNTETLFPYFFTPCPRQYPLLSDSMA